VWTGAHNKAYASWRSGKEEDVVERLDEGILDDLAASASADSSLDHVRDEGL
jgi:hypothetical protein